MNALTDQRQAMLATAKEQAAEALAQFSSAMIDAESAIVRLRELGLFVEIKHPMQALQTMRDTRLKVTLPEIVL